jgi:hypothetical protein
VYTALREAPEERSRRGVTVDGRIATRRTITNEGDVDAVSSGASAEVPSCGDRRCDEGQQLGEERLNAAQSLGDPGTGTQDHGTLAAGGDLPQTARGDQLVTPAGRNDDAVPSCVARVDELPGPGRARGQRRVGAQDHDGRRQGG